MEKFVKTRVAVGNSPYRISFFLRVNISECTTVSAGLPLWLVYRMYKAGVYPKETGIAGWYSAASIATLKINVENDVRTLVLLEESEIKNQ